MRYTMSGGSELPGVAPAALMHRQYDGGGGNIDSRGLPLSVFGNQWGCCPPLFDKCTDDQIMMLFHGLDAVEPGLCFCQEESASFDHEKARQFG